MTINDVNNSVEEKNMKKLSAFRDFVTFKKSNKIFTKDNDIIKNKTILDYYNKEDNVEEKLDNNIKNVEDIINDKKYDKNDNNIFDDKIIKSINFTKKK